MPWHSFGFLVILLYAIQLNVHAQNDNGIVGDPTLNCGDGHIEIGFETRTPFRGIVFVEDRLNDPSCRSPPSDQDGIRNTSLRVAFDSCGMQRKYSLTNRGLFITTRIIVAFHPEFLTKFDRLYQVQCFYMEMQRRLQKKIQISMPPPQMQTANVPMPVCRYEVLDEGPNGPPVFYTTIGQMVYHKWTCETEYPNTFCMTVHSCTVDDGNGDRVQLLDEKGCAQDKYLLNNLEYINDLMAGREAHVYKYADRENMYFDCEITITIKEPGQEYCDYPNCPDPPRRRRFSNLNLTEAQNLEHGSQKSSFNNNETTFEIDKQMVSKTGFMQTNFHLTQVGFCASTSGAFAYIAVNLGSVFITTVLICHSFTMLKSPKA